MSEVYKGIKSILTAYWTNVKNYIDTKLSGKSDTGHTHTKSQITDFAHTHDDRYFTETEVTNMLDGKSNTGHNHDDRYYTESEIDTKLSGKSDTGHTHTKSQITDFPTSLPANGGNADKVDNYHASQLWRSDGATWNPGANILLGAKANSDEWSFDISRNGKTGCYWHVCDSTLGSLLKVNADDGKVSAPKGFVGNLSGKADTAGTADSAAKATTATTAYKIRIGNSNPADGDIWIQ